MNQKPPTQRLGLIVVIAGIAIGLVVLVLQSLGSDAATDAPAHETTRVMGATAPEVPVERIEMKTPSDKGR